MRKEENSYRIKQKDWDDFLQSFDGFDCQRMCQNYFPRASTLDLFENPASSLVYCRWCEDKPKKEQGYKLLPLTIG